MKRFLLAFVALCLAPHLLAQSQFALIVASNVTDSAGNKLQSGTITFRPVLTPNSTAPATPHLLAGGRLVPKTVTFNVTGGVLSAPYGTAQLLDVTQSNPANFCYASTVHDLLNGDSWPLDSCYQPSSTGTGCTVSAGQTTCSLDGYVPTGTPGALVVAGPAGTINWRDAWAASTAYARNDGYVEGGNGYIVTTAYTSGSTFGSADTSNSVEIAVGCGSSPCTVTQGGIGVASLTPNQLLASGSTSTSPIQPSGITQSGSGSAQMDAFPGNISAGLMQGTPALSTYGTLLNQSSWTSTAGYVADGITPTVSGGALVFNGSSSTSFSQSYNWVGTGSSQYYTTLPIWTETITVTAGTPSSTSFGVGVGVRSTDGGYNALCSINLATATFGGLGVNSGVLLAYTTSGTQSNYSPTALSFSAGDSIQITASRNYENFSCMASDLTTPGSGPIYASLIWGYYDSNHFGGISPNVAQFAAYYFGGVQTLTSWNISSTAPVGANVMLVGDSKTVGFYAGAYSNIWSSALQQYTSAITLAGGGDTTYDVLDNLPEILALKPRNVILNIGRNDLCVYSTSLATIESNYSSIVSQLQAAGINVIHLLPLYETTCNQSSLTSWVQTTFSASSIINANLSRYGTAMVALDGIHPTAAANSLILQAVVAYLQGLSSLNELTYPSTAQPPPVVLGQNTVSNSGPAGGSNTLTVNGATNANINLNGVTGATEHIASTGTNSQAQMILDGQSGGETYNIWDNGTQEWGLGSIFEVSHDFVIQDEANSYQPALRITQGTDAAAFYGPVKAPSLAATGLGASANPLCTTTGGVIVNSGCGGGVTLQTNGTNNSSQTTLNQINSSTNATGLTDTVTNTTGGTVQHEIAGTVNAAHGGTGISTSSSTGVAQVSSGTWSVSTTLAPGLTIPAPAVLGTNAEYNVGTCTTSATISAANGNRQKVTLTNGDTCALSFTQPGSGTISITLKVIQSATSSYNGTISGCKWPGGTVPKVTATTGAVDFVSIYLDGTNAYCAALQNFM